MEVNSVQSQPRSMEGSDVHRVSALARREEGARVWTGVLEGLGVPCRRPVYGNTKQERSRSLWEQVQADLVLSFTL